MRSVDIKFSQRNAEPGGTISGVVVVETDKTFECNRVVLKVKGKERTEIGSGDSKIVDEHYHVKGKIELSEATEIPFGKSEFPFKFKLDEGLPPTFSGYNGWIEYSVEAVVEMDWTIDPKITLDDASEHYFHLQLEGDGLVLKVPRRMLENLKARVDEALKDADRINKEYRRSMQNG